MNERWVLKEAETCSTLSHGSASRGESCRRLYGSLVLEEEEVQGGTGWIDEHHASKHSAYDCYGVTRIDYQSRVQARLDLLALRTAHLGMLRLGMLLEEHLGVYELIRREITGKTDKFR